MAKGIADGRNVNDIAQPIDLWTSVIKPQNAQWLMRVHEIVWHERDLIVKGFRETGILKAVLDARM